MIAINQLIYHFRKKLRETELFEKNIQMPQNLGSYQNYSSINNNYLNFNNDNWLNSRYSNQNSNSQNTTSNDQLQSITIDQLLNIANIRESKSWGSIWNCVDIKSAQEINEIYEKLDEEIKKRRLYDCYFKIQNYNISDTRSYILSRLMRLIHNGIFTEDEKNHEPPKGMPNDKEIF